MTIRSDIKGLTEVGATAQTIALADVLYRNADSREMLRAIMDLAGEQRTYSGQDGDIKATLAAGLATIIRQYDGPEIN
jgi:hypothetical protein